MLNQLDDEVVDRLALAEEAVKQLQVLNAE